MNYCKLLWTKLTRSLCYDLSLHVDGTVVATLINTIMEARETKQTTADNEETLHRLLIYIKLRSGYFPRPLESPEQNNCCQVKSWSGLKSRSHEWRSSNRWQPVERLCGCQSLFGSGVQCSDILEAFSN